MHIRTITLRNFRNIAQLSLPFSAGVSAIIAPNGTGKTNIIEAISFLSRGKTDRGERESDLFPWDQPHPRFCRIEGTILAQNNESSRIQVTLREGIHRAEKSILFDDVKKRACEMPQYFPALFFSPETLQVVAGSPSRRREFFDHVLPLFDKRYRPTLQKYTKAIQQRNRLLQEPHCTPQALAPWDEQVALAGSCITVLRNSITQRCQEFFTTISKLLHSSVNTQHIFYKSSVATEDYREVSIQEKIRKELLIAYPRDRATGMTHIGPHRDDWEFFLGEMNLKTFGSRGQQRMGSIALLMSTFLLLCEILETKPVLLLDDLFSELDSDHSEKLFQFLASHCGQCLLTATDLALTHPKLAKTADMINLQQCLEKR